MSLISSFITSKLLSFLESEFQAHESGIQAAIISEVESLASDLVAWVNTKTTSSVTTASHDNGE